MNRILHLALGCLLGAAVALPAGAAPAPLSTPNDLPFFLQLMPPSPQPQTPPRTYLCSLTCPDGVVLHCNTPGCVPNPAQGRLYCGPSYLSCPVGP